MFNLQANSFEIASGIKDDLDMQITKIGLTINSSQISSFSYPEEIQRMQNKVASQSMLGDMNKYTRLRWQIQWEKAVVLILPVIW